MESYRCSEQIHFIMWTNTFENLDTNFDYLDKYFFLQIYLIIWATTFKKLDKYSNDLEKTSKPFFCKKMKEETLKCLIKTIPCLCSKAPKSHDQRVAHPFLFHTVQTFENSSKPKKNSQDSNILKTA